MRLRDRPLLLNGLDDALYVSRPALQQTLVTAARLGRNVLLLGESGAGKTSLLRWMARQLGEEGEQSAAWVNAALATDASTFLELVQQAVGHESALRSPAGRAATPTELLVATRRLSEATPMTLLVDGLLDGELGFNVFGRLRDELWATGHTWIVAARPRDSGMLRTPPADAFWSRVVEIPPLDVDETTDMLKRGLSGDEYERVDRDRPLGGLSPRDLVREVETRLTADGAESRSHSGVAVETLQRRASELGRSEGMAMTELIGMGRPVSAHDGELLERLGWTRPYAQRVLAHLESGGLVRTMPERDAGRAGRPRKLYEAKLQP